MLFSVYSEMQCPPGKAHVDIYWEHMRQVELADQLGFDAFSLIDHHHFPEFGISTNPLAFFTAAAQRTKRIRFRTWLHNLSIHNPLILAGEITAADILTEGRLDIGVGRGHAWVFPKASIPLEDAMARADEGIAILLDALENEYISCEGKHYNARNVHIVPRPIQKKFKIFAGGTSDKSYERAGRLGWAMTVPPLVPLNALTRQLDIYREACAKHDHKPHVAFIRTVYMDEDPAVVKRDAEKAFRHFTAGNAAPTGDMPPKEELLAKGFPFYASGTLESIAALSYEELREQGAIWAGTPEQVTEMVQEVLEKCEGVAEIAFVPNYGGIEHWKVTKTLQLLAEKVIPQLR